jgi:REP element-mobilizing transposase RayT
MPRKPRIEFNGAFYHVIARGNQRQKIFKDATDFQKYLQFLTIYKNRYSYHLYAYVLMSNHVHLLIETGDIPLSRILQGINQSYTMHFNRRYRTVGHLFQGRYKAILCDRDAYLLALLKYIHHNPLRARIAETLDLYPWSSHHAYTDKNNPLGLVDADRVLRMFSETKGRARKHYRAFMTDGQVMKKDEVYAAIDQRLQGDDEFVDHVLEKYDGEVKRERRKKEHSLPQIAKIVEKQYGLTLQDIRSSVKEQRVMRGRRAFSSVAREYGYKGREIAEYLTKEPSSVTKYIKGEDIKPEVEKLIRLLRAAKNGNNQV